MENEYDAGIQRSSSFGIQFIRSPAHFQPVIKIITHIEVNSQKY
jgi:hypothetical protein